MKNLLKFTTFLCLISSLAFGQTAQDVVKPFIGIPSVGARASGLGQSYTGVANDVSAMHYNPAGLAHMTWSELSFGGTYIAVDNSFTAGGINSSIARNYMHINNLGYAWPAYGTKLTLAAGYYTTSLLNRAFDINAPNYQEMVEEETIMGAYSIGLGYQLQKELSVGLSLHLYRGENTYTDQYSEPYNSVVNFYEDTYQIEADYSGLGATFGFLWAPTNFLRTGVSIRSPVNMKTDESLIGTERVYYPESDTIETNSYDWTGEYRIKAPLQINIGQSINIGGFMLTGGIHWKDWSLFQIDTDITEGGSPIEIDVNNDIRNNFVSGLDALEYSLGGELLLPLVNLKVRGGLHYIPSYLQDDSIEDKLVTSLGTSILLAQSFKIDIAYNQTSWDEQFQENESATLDNIWTTVNFSYRF